MASISLSDVNTRLGTKLTAPGNVFTGNLQIVGNATITDTFTANFLVGNGQGITGLVGGSGGLTITNVAITDANGVALDDTALGDGSYVKITGTGFGSGAVAMLGTVSATSTTGISQTELRAQFVGVAAGTYSLFVINTDGSSAVLPNGVTWSDFPAWTTTSLAPVTKMRALSQSIAATGDSAITYTANNIPSGTTLTSAGLLSGNITEFSNVTTVYTFTAEATDAELQSTAKILTLSAGFLRNFTQTDNPNMSSATYVSGQRYTLNGYFTDASDKLGSGGESFKAFDKTNASIWHSANGLTTNPKWISFQYPSAVLLASYAITASPEPTNIWSPFTWTFQGSNDGTTWATLDSQTGVTFTVLQSRTFSVFPVVTAYIYFRLYVTNAAHLGTIPGGDYVIVSELIISTRSAGVVVSNSSFTGDTNHLAVLPSGGHVKIIADSPAFFSNAVAKLGTANLSTTLASSTELRAVVPAAPEGTTRSLEIVNSDGSVLTGGSIAQWALPAWTTASGQLGAAIYKGDAFSRTVAATHGAGSVTYATVSGTFPDGVSFNSGSGVISGSTPGGATDETITLVLNAISTVTLQNATRELTLSLLGQLFAYTSHTFTTAGAAGRTGPTLAQCQYEYSTTTFVSTNFNVYPQGVQMFGVPRSGVYEIEVGGSQGGTGYNSFASIGFGGLGRIVRARFALTINSTMFIIVGQRGLANSQPANGGGGGASRVYLGTLNYFSGGITPLIIAGGGGGGRYNTAFDVLQNANYTTNGNNGLTGSTAGGTGGSGGNGGNCGVGGITTSAPENGVNGSGGRGGGTGTTTGNLGVGGGGGGVGSSTSTFLGGAPQNSGGGPSYYGAEGGFGGGGGGGAGNSINGSGGGGGGYSGGGGGGTNTGGGGGGGSYIAASGTNVTDLGLNGTRDNTTTQRGYVKITYIS